MPFHRYTNLASAIHILSTKTITLLNPATWDDRNDAHFMAEYKRLRGAETLLALCFAEHTQTYHHWRVFANGADGVCIEFDKDRLLSTLKHPGLKHKAVDYYRINDAKKMPKVGVEDLPFIKRSPYNDEREYRVIYENAKAVEDYKDFPIDVSWIFRVTLSPWMPKALVKSVKAHLRTIDGCKKLDVFRSTLTDNEAWKSLTAHIK